MLILASGSPYRRAQLSQLNLPFRWVASAIDETPHPHEPCQALVARLAREKAAAVARTETVWEPDSLIIGSDQSAELQGIQLQKPGNHRNAVAQLRHCRGQWVYFHTAVAVYHPRSETLKQAQEETRVLFRQLSDEQIEHYLQQEQPYDCAGSFKVEGLGITLFEKIESRDPSALVGLPLIALTDLLIEYKRHPLTAQDL